jgi:GNAT superfamily N-acetyltransferase
MTSAYRIASFIEQPDQIDAAHAIIDAGWPNFMLKHRVAIERRATCLEIFTDTQYMLLSTDDTIMAVANTVPVVWDGRSESLPPEGHDAMFEQAVRNHEHNIQPTALCALSITVHPDYLGQGFSFRAIRAVKAATAARGFSALIIALRPTLKPRYVLTPMERYIHWQRDDGEPFDPWLRVHRRFGAEVVGVCPRSRWIEGSVADWETWTDMRFPESGTYVVPGALVPVDIDCEQDHGLYVEPNVWIVHSAE